jgi:hypothetical protein
MNRKEIRNRLKELIELEMVGEDKILHSVSSHPTLSLAGSPHIAIRSQGTERTYEYVGSDFSGNVELKLFLLVDFNIDAENDYDEEAALEILDNLDEELGKVVEKYRTDDLWTNLVYSAGSTVSIEQLNEGYFLVEEVTLKFEIM